MSSIKRQPTGKWRARYRDASGREHARHFPTKVAGQRWLDEITSSVVTGTYVDPKTARTTFEEWSATWLAGYGTRRGSTLRQAQVHITRLVAEFGPVPLGSIRPSQVRSWTAALRADGYADSYVYALHARLSQVLSDAVHDGLLARNPCSRRTSPGQGKQRPYLATTGQVWALHDAMPEHLRPAILLGAFVGLRTAEMCGLRLEDVDLMRGIIRPAVQFPAEPLKTPMSQTPVPIPAELALDLARYVVPGSGWLVTNLSGGQLHPVPFGRAFRSARDQVVDLPAGFRYHDLRHYFASLLIASGASVKVVQARLRHASAETTLDTYGHLWPDADESTRAAVSAVIVARSADYLRTVPTSS